MVVCSRIFFIVVTLPICSDFALIDVAPAPVFSGLEGLDDGVLRLMEMLGGVLVGRAVATADVSADEAEAKVNPLSADLEAVFAAVGRWGDVANL
jgi:hypothetical protein